MIKWLKKEIEMRSLDHAAQVIACIPYGEKVQYEINVRKIIDRNT